MELKWIEDFLALAESGSFSRSADSRHVSQPAFSRRIMALEEWAGATLFDRGTTPVSLTAAGERFRQHANAILQAAEAARLSAAGEGGLQTLRFALPHALARSFYPRWLSRLENVFASVPTQTFAANVDEAVRSLARRECDFLITYHHPQLPIRLDPQRYSMLTLGMESVRPYSACDAKGAPLFRLDGGQARAVPYLAYAPEAWLARIAELLLAQSSPPPRLKTVYQNDMAENLKAMALEGHGVAFLPESTVLREVEQGQLCAAAEGALTAQLEIRIVRDSSLHSAFLDQIWERLRASL